MLVINFFGAPSSGKPTLAMNLCALLKMKGIDAEYVSEVAKDYIWENHADFLSHQNLIFAQQEVRLARLRGKVSVAVSDAPLMNASFYAPKPYFDSFHQLCLDHFNAYNNINFFIERDHSFSEIGRLQNEEQSHDIHASMYSFLKQRQIHLECYKSSKWNSEDMYHQWIAPRIESS